MPSGRKPDFVNRYKVFSNRAEIYLRPGVVVLIDKEDVEKARKYHWNTMKRQDRRPYVRHLYRIGDKTRAFCLHQLIFGKMPGMVIDHINGNVLDNRKINLRFATTMQNGQNRRDSGQGVTERKPGRWWARIRVNKQLIVLGTYNAREEAMAARLEAEKKYFGEFAPRRKS